MEKTSRKTTWFIALFLLAASFAVYWQVLHQEFIRFDEEVYVTDNPQVLKGLTYEGLRYAFTSSDAGLWHPLTWLSLMADRQLFGNNAGGYHLTSLLFHLANTLLLFFIFQRMTGSSWRSGFIAALFALHPLHVESVAWIAERKDVLSAFFWMLTMGAYLFYVEHPSLSRYLLVLFSFSLGLMAKPMVVTLPCVMLLLDYWPLHRYKPEANHNKAQARLPDGASGSQASLFFLLLEKIPLFIMALLAGLVTVLMEKKIGALVPLGSLTLGSRLENALVSYADYLVKMVWPVNLAVFYPHPGHFPLRDVILALMLLLLITVLVMRWIKIRPYLAVGWLWYLATLLPVSGLVQVGSHATADRYTYIPLIGIFVILGWGVPELFSRLKGARTFLFVLAGVTLLLLMMLTVRQVSYWQNSESLFRHAISVTEGNYLAYNNLGAVLMSKGDVKGAIDDYLQALAFRPAYAVSHNNLGNALTVAGDWERAKQHFQEALIINPDYGRAHRNFGDLLMRRGESKEALAHYRRALSLLGDDPELHNNLGVALTMQGDFAGAIGHFRRALVLRSDYPEAKKNLGRLLTARH